MTGVVVPRLVHALFLLVLSCLSAVAGAGRPADDLLPAMAVKRLDGAPASTAQWRGRPTVVNVWATWCPPCRSEMPALQRLSDRLQAAGIDVVGLSVDEDANLVREFVLKYRIRFPVVIALASGDATSALGARALPLTLYVDAQGRVVERVVGPRDWGDEAMAREIMAKLGER